MQHIRERTTVQDIQHLILSSWQEKDGLCLTQLQNGDSCVHLHAAQKRQSFVEEINRHSIYS